MNECINPAEIQPGDLMAYADGEAARHVVRHVERCAFCAAQAATYRTMQAGLTAVLHRASCPAPEILGDFHLSLLPPGQKLAVALHLRVCTRCAAELAAYDVPPQPAAFPEARTRLGGTIREVVEALLVPARRPLSAPRGQDLRQQLYQAASLHILVGYRPTTARRGTLSGAILWPEHGGPDAGTTPCGHQEPGQVQGLPLRLGVQVQLFRHGDLLATQPVNELGHFVFEDVAADRYNLMFDWQGRAVLITDIACSEAMT